jgi:NADP-dependent 3-hydroxy acid dehydrogenase YdfG
MPSPETLRPGAIALVTGASRGIGRAIAEGLLARSQHVICTSRKRGNLDDLCAGQDGKAYPLALDVTDGAACAACIESLPDDWREIDVLVANAGSDVGGRVRFDEGDMADWAATVETNVTGLMAVCHAVLPGMLARGRGHIVTLGSIAGLRTYPAGNVYAATKYAVRAFTQGLRLDYKHEPIRITEVLPGMVRTGFAEARHRGDRDKAAEFYDSFPAVLEAEDIAAAALFALEQPPQVNIAQIVVVPTGDK